MLGLRTLVLTNSFMPASIFPLDTISAEDAVSRITNLQNPDGYSVVAEYDRRILHPTLDMNWPSVIVCNNTFNFRKNAMVLRKESLFYRDHGVCAYCEEDITVSGLTYDHVIPKSRGGRLNWENVVASCISCNANKGNRLPEGQWVPKHKPYAPSYWELLASRRKFPITVDDKSWIDFLGDWHGEVIIRKAASVVL